MMGVLHLWLTALPAMIGFAVLAWLIAGWRSNVGLVDSAWSLDLADILGAAVVVFGIVFESLADYQLAFFRANVNNRDAVMDRGLWRWPRHPKYFGERCVWWVFCLIAAAAGAWWTLVSPVLMTLLLLKVLGVGLLEKTFTVRRPGYRAYIERTPAFIPGRPHR